MSNAWTRTINDAAKEGDVVRILELLEKGVSVDSRMVSSFSLFSMLCFVSVCVVIVLKDQLYLHFVRQEC